MAPSYTPMHIFCTPRHPDYRSTCCPCRTSAYRHCLSKSYPCRSNYMPSASTWKNHPSCMSPLGMWRRSRRHLCCTWFCRRNPCTCPHLQPRTCRPHKKQEQSPHCRHTQRGTFCSSCVPLWTAPRCTTWKGMFCILWHPLRPSICCPCHRPRNYRCSHTFLSHTKPWHCYRHKQTSRDTFRMPCGSSRCRPLCNTRRRTRSRSLRRPNCTRCLCRRPGNPRLCRICLQGTAF